MVTAQAKQRTSRIQCGINSGCHNIYRIGTRGRREPGYVSEIRHIRPDKEVDSVLHGQV